MTNNSFNIWRNAIFAVKNPTNYTQAQKFSSLLKMAEGSISVDVAVALFGLLTDYEDHGLKQSVIRMLSSFPVYEYYKALMRDLPRMTKECQHKDWPFAVSDYVGRDLTIADMQDIVLAYRESSELQQEAFLNTIRSQEFFHEHDWPEKFLQDLKSR